jgi:hypothetical protein
MTTKGHKGQDMRQRELEAADRIEVETCDGGACDHLHLVLYDEDGQAYAEATLGVDQCLPFVEHIKRTLYAMAAEKDG